MEQTQEVFLKRASSRFCASNNLLCGRPQLRNDSRFYGFQFVQLFSFVGRSRSSETKKNAELKQQREREAKSRAKETPAFGRIKSTKDSRIRANQRNRRNYICCMPTFVAWDYVTKSAAPTYLQISSKLLTLFC